MGCCPQVYAQSLLNYFCFLLMDFECRPVFACDKYTNIMHCAVPLALRFHQQSLQNGRVTPYSRTHLNSMLRRSLFRHPCPYGTVPRKIIYGNSNSSYSFGNLAVILRCVVFLMPTHNFYLIILSRNHWISNGDQFSRATRIRPTWRNFAYARWRQRSDFVACRCPVVSLPQILRISPIGLL